MQIDIQAVANYVLDVCDFDERYEDDCFCVEVCDVRWYVERRARHFVLHVGEGTVRLPRC